MVVIFLIIDPIDPITKNHRYRRTTALNDLLSLNTAKGVLMIIYELIKQLVIAFKAFNV